MPLRPSSSAFATRVRNTKRKVPESLAIILYSTPNCEGGGRSLVDFFQADIAPKCALNRCRSCSEINKKRNFQLHVESDTFFTTRERRICFTGQAAGGLFTCRTIIHGSTFDRQVTTPHANSRGHASGSSGSSGSSTLMIVPYRSSNFYGRSDPTNR